MEGPSLAIASEQLQPFKGKKILTVSGNSKIGIERFQDLIVRDIFSWGKHLVFQFDDFAMRIHFLLFGTFEAVVEGVSVTGDYKRAKEPRLTFEFGNGEIKMFNCSVKIFEDKDYKKSYDFSIDTMLKEWDGKNALEKVLAQPEEQLADVLLDQEIFAGVGNIIKNEVLFRQKVHPDTLIKNLTSKQLTEIIDDTQVYVHLFFKWRKKFELKKHYQIYRQKFCPVSGDKVVRQKTGKRQRWSFYCPTCQPQVESLKNEI